MMMNTKWSRQRVRSVAPQLSDRLSSLPENVIDSIVTCLPLRDAVRTSILSKKWRYNWCRLPELTLDEALWGATKDSVSPTAKFTDIIYNILTLHTGPITKFTLSIPALGNCPKIDNLICFLSRNGIQDLLLQLSKSNLYRLPSSFFSCLQMKHVTLHNCVIRPPPPSFNGFDSLISLELRDVTISSKLLESLISLCPVLEELVLEISTIFEHIKINAPKLRSFDFIGRSIHYICLKNCPLLVKLSLLDRSLAMADNCDRSMFFESFPALEHLHLDYLSVEFLAAGTGEVPTRLPSALNCLKHLCLLGISLGDFVEASCALCLIRSSPYLQYLGVEVYHKAIPCHEISSLEDLQVDGFSDVTLDHLKSVRLSGITGSKPEMELIKLILAKSPVLVKMLIEPEPARIEVLAELTRFRRASPLAKVVYDLDYKHV